MDCTGLVDGTGWSGLEMSEINYSIILYVQIVKME